MTRFNQDPAPHRKRDCRTALTSEPDPDKLVLQQSFAQPPSFLKNLSGRESQCGKPKVNPRNLTLTLYDLVVLDVNANSSAIITCFTDGTLESLQTNTPFLEELDTSMIRLQASPCCADTSNAFFSSKELSGYVAIGYSVP